MVRYLYKSWGKIGVVGKITGIIGAILIIPVMIICIFYYSIFHDSLIKEEQKGLDESLELLKGNMNDNLDKIESVIQELDYKQEYAYFFNPQNDLSSDEKNYYYKKNQEELRNIRSLYPNKFNQISFYSYNKDLIHGSVEWQYDLDVLKEQNYREEVFSDYEGVFFGKVREMDFLASAPQLEGLNIQNGNELVLPAYYKIKNLSTKELLGVIEVDMELSRLLGMNNLKKNQGKDRYLLFDSKGQLLYADSDLHLKDDPRENSSLFDKKFNEKSGNYDIRLNHKTYMMAYNHCERTGLIQAVVVDKSEAVAFATNMIVKVVGLAIISIIVVILLIHFVIRRMLNRLIVLDEKIGEIETGKFDVLIEDDGKNDEIARVQKHFNEMAANLQKMMDIAVEKEKSQKEAELKALQAQINPHFLYNTLENMRMQCEIDDYTVIGDCLAALGELFRYSIKWRSNEVPFGIEWKNLMNYVSIMKMRFEDEVKFILECEEGIEDIVVPKMILQPLVENCFEHGFREAKPPWLLLVRAYREDQQLVLIIEDNGLGISLERLEEIRQCMKEYKALPVQKHSRNSIGIINVKRRIDLVCGKGSTMEIDSPAGGGTRISIRIAMGEDIDV